VVWQVMGLTWRAAGSMHPLSHASHRSTFPDPKSDERVTKRTSPVSGTPHLGVNEFSAPAEAEATRGEQTHLDFLRAIHAQLSPRFYLEIGIRHGNSLVLANCPAVGVDPAPEIGAPLAANIQIVAETSDEFFACRANEVLTAPVDLAFIDGMHWFEFALRDFVNIERRAHAATVVVFDDIFPAHSWQAERDRRTRVWTGDIWKIVVCLRKFRPDLMLIPCDTWPTGMLLVLGLDADNETLSQRYEQIVREYVENANGTVPAGVLSREGAWAPDDPRLGGLLESVRNARSSANPSATIGALLAAFRAAV
jgi:predicted O-methyltransferase YrrM